MSSSDCLVSCIGFKTPVISPQVFGVDDDAAHSVVRSTARCPTTVSCICIGVEEVGVARHRAAHNCEWTLCCTLRCPQHCQAPRNCQWQSSLVSKKLALHVTELHAEAAAAEHVLHTLLSAAPQGASQPSAAPPMESKKLALYVTELHAPTADAELHVNDTTTCPDDAENTDDVHNVSIARSHTNT